MSNKTYNDRSQFEKTDRNGLKIIPDNINFNLAPGNHTLFEGDSGITFTIDGTAPGQITLPSPRQGLMFIFLRKTVNGTDDIDIRPPDNNTFFGTSSSSHGVNQGNGDDLVRFRRSGAGNFGAIGDSCMIRGIDSSTYQAVCISIGDTVGFTAPGIVFV